MLPTSRAEVPTGMRGCASVTNNGQALSAYLVMRIDWAATKRQRLQKSLVRGCGETDTEKDRLGRQKYSGLCRLQSICGMSIVDRPA